MPEILDYATDDRNATSGGCLPACLGVAWIVVITLTVPISSDRYTAPLWLKWVVTIGHAAAIWAMVRPARGRAMGWKTLVVVGATLLGLWATLEVAVMWFWN